MGGKQRMSRVIGMIWLSVFLLVREALAMAEDHRMEEYHKRGYKWPLEKMVPDTPGWKRIMDKRFEQVERVEDSTERYNGWMGFITSAIVAANYTENGWGLTRAPDHITRRLQERLHRNLEVARIERKECDAASAGEEGECVATEREIYEPKGRKEHYVNVIGGEDHARPIMITDNAENNDILQEMKPMFEWWSGLDLQESIAYGIRAYRNDSNLLMHVDKSSTHVISGIFHVDRSEDAEPWPIVIEDLHGNTNQVYLEPGDVLFYESSKCFHGRPQTFIGGYYASLFMHYRPVEFSGSAIHDEIHYAVPAHWRRHSPPKEGLDELVVVGTSFKEPNCKNLLCSLDETHPDSRHLVHWHGPAPRGKIATTGWDPETMTPPKEWEKEGYDGGKRNLAGETKGAL
mmetsp:Transcript_4838/g.10401  ORF Transcript_4838/g.10401 Transcript_4838/m.10401 type:complete len:403 (-) Transcript_4838:438-1646(-)|eukprot:CAMPEP_0172540446 /NCGR_PEP_ID=MMETSP1067-20121228/11464_1 /TAXON_ID=265564 ORGANISM="Thalassiosira punctigera, Strain Tpunct2005C2" /NCGR_SAMPLE_ID=MMETSP1067 /ASSEMBLY_ACC=CAM_ASM_000444 /LENGTH=402 /DNA_ID=CAMNT_0013326309 /DNA_START=104 /DNA_END=1312 /DNA_ORIENTATION=+